MAKKFRRLGVRLGREFKWRRPKGRHNKQKLRLKSRPKMPSIGMKKKIRHKHPSGLTPVRISCLKDLEKIHDKNVILIISRTVGERKRIQIIERASELGLKISNPGGEIVE